MSYGLYVSAEGAHSQEYRLRTIANNIANVDTPGFKREVALQMARHTERIDQGYDYPGSGSINDISGGVITVGTKTEFMLGKVESTTNPTDLTIADDGKGFFVVQDPRNGEFLLTRAGNFEILSDGQLVLQSGKGRYSVVDEDMQPIFIDVSDPTWRINDDGTVQQAGGVFTNIAIVRSNNYNDMLKLGENVYRALDGFTPVAQTDRKVKAFTLERSSVNPAAEMIEMIVTARAIETNTKMMQNQDEMTAGLLNKVLSLS
ncbi:MAG: flagellar hook basal-body protein [Planctomycetaceae bacterium]|nr:flagellar hook basal-body protein [Planctomycetaceae bacterium]MCL2305219.1 flagellar hook basal-body protein [Planctomycetaceae bacterium]